VGAKPYGGCTPTSPLLPELPLLPPEVPLLLPTVLVCPPHATLAAAAASVVVNANAAARVSRLLVPGSVVTDAIALLQNGHVVSFART
jgi:hypothetical protein